MRGRLLLPLCIQRCSLLVIALLMASHAGGVTFEEARDRAIQAQQSNRLADAAAAYGEALDHKPDWDEGWWGLSTVLYELNSWNDCRESLERLTEHQPRMGGAWAMRGLCEFSDGKLDAALSSLEKVPLLGLPEGSPLAPAVQYHLGILLTRAGKFEESIKLLEALAAVTKQPVDQLTAALGLSMLRAAALPGSTGGRDPEAVRLAGEAAFLAATLQAEPARAGFEELVRRFPAEPNTHYAFGTFLLTSDSDRAVEEFRRELDVSPGHVPARLQLAFEYLKRNNPAAGLPYAREAVAMQPEDFAARTAYGRLLLELGKVEESVSQLEAAVRLAPNSGQARFALARAYTRAGRSQDAEREHTEFQRLEKLQRKR